MEEDEKDHSSMRRHAKLAGKTLPELPKPNKTSSVASMVGQGNRVRWSDRVEDVGCSVQSTCGIRRSRNECKKEAEASITR